MPLLSTPRLAELIDAPAVQSLMDDFYALVAVPMSVVDTEGQVLVGVGWQDICTQFHRVHPDTCRACIESDTQLTTGIQPGEFRLYKCKNQMWDVATPIIVGDRHVGNIFSGQFFFADETVDRETFREQAHRHGFDEKTYLAALDRVPRLSRHDVSRALAFFVKLAQMVSRLGEANLSLATAIDQRDGLIAARNRALRSESEQREQLRVTMASMGDGVIVTDEHGRVTFLNKIAELLTGWSSAEAQLRPLSDVFRIVCEPSREVVESPVAKVLRLGVVVGLANHTVLLARDGQEIPIEDSAAPVRDEDGHIKGIVLLFRDGRERRAAERALERERSLLTTVMHATDVMLAFLDADFNFLMVNAAYAEACRMRPDAMVGRNHFALYPHEENEAIFRRVRDSGEPVFCKDKPFEFPDQPERGTTYWDWSLVPVKDDGRVTGLVFSLRETTRFRMAEETLRRTERNANALLNAASESVWLFDPDGRILFTNMTAASRLGRTPAELEGRMAWDYLSPALAEARRAQLGEVVRTGSPVRFDDERDGITFSHSFDPVLGDEGTVVAVAAFSRDVTALKQVRQSLEVANARLQEADRRKDEWIAILSHELRNPLAPIRFALPLLLAEPLDEGGRRAVAAIGRQTEHLTRLVDDLLDLSRITSGKIDLRRERASLDSILTAATEAASPAILERRHTLHLATRSEGVWVHVDPPRITQVLTNLLDNSAKYTPHGGTITLEAFPEDAEAVIRVRDTGIGIPADALPTVFDMFRQVQRRDRPQGGLGIGLALARRLVEMHGGTIEARSDGIGRGAQFTVRLPLARAGAAADASRDSASAEGASALRVLIVDDNADLAEMLAMLVEGAGHQAWKASDGPDAIAAARTFGPDVVLLDLGLPGMDGIAVAGELRAHPELGRPTLVALTGWGQPEDRQRTRQASFEYHLTKPADPRVVLELLAKIAEEKGR